MIKNKLPTDTSDFKITLKVCRLVLSTPVYFILLLTLVPLFLILLILPNDYTVIIDVVILGESSAFSKTLLVYNLLPLTGGVTYSLFTDSMMYIVSMSVSTNITLLIYHLKEHGFQIGGTASGTTSSILSVIGSGCASCGSTILTGLFSVLGISGALSVLPLHGGEFLLISLIISFLSIYWIANGLRGGMVKGCPI